MEHFSFRLLKSFNLTHMNERLIHNQIKDLVNYGYDNYAMNSALENLLISPNSNNEINLSREGSQMIVKLCEEAS